MTAGRSTPELFGDAISLVTDLFRTEVKLARAEIGEKASQAVSGAIVAVVGAILLLSALVLLLAAAVDWIVTLGFARYLAGLMVGGGVAVLGLILLLVAVGRLKPANLAPRRTLGQLGLSSGPADSAGRVS